MGRRYSRADEIGCPYGITIDFDTLTQDSVTLRERDSTAQIRVKINELVPLLLGLVGGQTLWSEVMGRFPVVRTGDEGDEEGEDGGVGGGGGVSAAGGTATVVEKTPRGRFSRPAEAELPDVGKLSLK